MRRLTSPSSVLNYAGAPTGTVTVVAALASNQIRVLAAMFYQWNLTGDTIQFQDNTGTPIVLLTAVEALITAPIVLPFTEYGWFDVAVGKQLDVVVSGGNYQVVLSYIYVPV